MTIRNPVHSRSLPAFAFHLGLFAAKKKAAATHAATAVFAWQEFSN
ncbi:hypothetical protein X737_13455 [Mesorhizobium sp. L48C026A00]|nr:hypothetical protein X737_13455 [Mesorhizobium sp. L48C026A00]